jgi:ABC-type metal ion transport system substrate-binding protein
VPITVSYRTETGHTLKKDLILTRRASNSKWASVFVKRESDENMKTKREILAEHEAITWTIL